MRTIPPVFGDFLCDTVCLMHDLAEAVVGDITPYQGVSKEEKRRLEEVYYPSVSYLMWLAS